MSVFIQPPGIEELKRRLISRSTDSLEVIQTRLDKAEYELSFANKFDYILVNDSLDKAQEEAFELISEFINK